MEKLAIHGGTPVKITPYGTAKRFGMQELSVEEKISDKTKAVAVVHLAGNAARLTKL